MNQPSSIKPRMGDVMSDGAIVDDRNQLVYTGKTLVRSSRLKRARKFGWKLTGRGDPAKGALVVEVERKNNGSH